MSKETKKKIADSNRGSKHTEESKEKMRQTRLEYYRNKKNENN